MIERYKTVLEMGEGEIIEKKSRFIGTACPVSSEQEAKVFIESMKKKYYNASHNAFAFQVEGDTIQRMSDDGEPSGTAGLPILELLKGEDLKNTVVNVTRYFGGTLLGTGGLVRAYGKAAKEGILSAKIIEKILYQIMHVTVDYGASGKVQYEALQNNHVIQDTVYTDQVAFVILTEFALAKGFSKRLADLTGGAANIQMSGAVYGTWVDGTLQVEEV